MIGARLRLVHPFPSLINGVAVFAMASVAGGTSGTAMRLGLGMLFIQFAIGTLNDLHDAPRDGGRHPAKPIPTGVVGISTARAVAVGSATGGLILAVPSGPLTLLIAAAGLGCGVAYDLWLSRTPISWLPLALALPLVPVYAWVGASGDLPASILAVVPIAVLAGAGLAIGNALADIEPDRAGSRRTIAVALGPAAAWAAHAGSLMAAIVLAMLFRPDGGGVAAERMMLAGAGLVLAGVVLSAVPRWIAPRFGWGLEAVGVAAIGVGWALAATGAS